jgi:hypothetical protein
MSTFQTILGMIVAAALVALLWSQYRRQDAKRADQGRVLFEPVSLLFDAPVVERGMTAGVWSLNGQYRNHNFQFKTVVDTLATRKLPSLWLMVTLPEPQPVTATTDMMMRAAGVTSFSNFEFLPHTLALPTGFPEQATLRSDFEKVGDVVSLMARHLELFHRGRGKEFLISPKGLRIVVQLAEGDRARYGVFREANFEGTSIDVDLAKELMDTLIDLRNDIHHHVSA